MFKIYRFLSNLFLPFILFYLLIRRVYGKEDRKRFGERLGFASIKRDYNKKLIWIHGASIGEAMSAIPLIEALKEKYKDHEILLTTITTSSASIIHNKYKSINHQYLPVDSSYSVEKFLNYWLPDVAIFLESELWPNLIIKTSKQCPVILANGRISDLSFKKWLFFKCHIKFLLNKFSLIIPQSRMDSLKFTKLLSNTCDEVISSEAKNIKFCAKKLTFNIEEVNNLKSLFEGHQILVAASTHPGDEEFIINAFQEIKNHKLKLIIVPRHIQRKQDIGNIIKSHNLRYNFLSKIKDGEEIDVLIMDAYGKMGVVFELGDIIFIGGSISNGGHNPIEAAFFKKPIIMGPDIRNFSEMADLFTVNEAIIRINEGAEFTNKIQELLDNPTLKEDLSINAFNLVNNSRQEVLDYYLNQLHKFIIKHEDI